MPVNKSKASRSALGENPLSQSIFSKTEVETQPPVEVGNIQDSIINNQDSTTKNQETAANNLDSTINHQDSRFLNKGEREAVNLRLPLELNDWLNDLLKKGKRQHGAKIPKEVWVQAALELFRAMPVTWSEVDSEESLRSILVDIESRLKNAE
ncbi:hypothetical protein BV378_24600 [Nostoc sp. RF31YmG]|jgi:hypothetical protein|nr:hypothetical protein BV378_24600 [Nostoc sp. RF31YmG]